MHPPPVKGPWRAGRGRGPGGVERGLTRPAVRVRLPALHRRAPVKELASSSPKRPTCCYRDLPHLAVALAIQALEQGYGTYSIRAYALMEDMRRAQAEHRLDLHMRVCMAPKVLIVDKFGIWPYTACPRKHKGTQASCPPPPGHTGEGTAGWGVGPVTDPWYVQLQELAISLWPWPALGFSSATA